MKYQIKKCTNCKIKFKAPTKELKRGNGKFCSVKCGAIYNGKHRPKLQPNVKCAMCKKHFYKSQSSLKNSKSKLYFCCRAHKDAAQCIGGIREIMPSHYGTSTGKSGYRKTAFDSYACKCDKCGYNKYKSIMVVHHIDHNRDNNNVSNLQILCRNCHLEHHLGLK